ncbi:hypothetical protein DFH09DRAFT_1094181 [Mycena vulgaris]|nr:hypothetical protein DFH09DRAFT_1094181 [Mycena vulgaris]
MSTTKIPPSKQRTRETQEKLDRLQELRDRRRPVKRGPPVLPFPSSPPTVTPPISPPSQRPAPAPRQSSPSVPISDCPQCTQEVFPRKNCTCGTAEQRESAWQAAKDRWFKEQPKAWFDHYAPPQRTDAAEILADLDAMWEDLARLREAKVSGVAGSRAGAFSKGGAHLADDSEALRKGRMTSGLKIWLNPALVDVKRMAAGRPPEYISFYNRKIAHFKARDKRRALLKLQREALPRRPLRRGYRHPPVEFTWVAVSGKDAGKDVDMDGRAEADLKEAHRIERLTFFPHHLAPAYNLTMSPTTYDKRAPEEKVSAAATRIRRRRRGAEKIVAPVAEPKPGDMVLPSPGDRSVPESLPVKTTKDEEPEVESLRGWDGEAFYQALIEGAQNFKWDKAEAEASKSRSLEETEKDRAWATATRMCIDGMREPDRREWLDLQEHLAELQQERVRAWCMEPQALRTPGVNDGVWADYSPSASVRYLDL